MRALSLRTKVALSGGLLTALVVLVFAGFSASRFYHEEIDMVSGDESRAPTPEQITDAKRETGELMLAYLAALPVAGILSAMGAWWMAARLTRPLVRLNAAAENIDAQSLDARLPEPAGRDEISTLARTLNRLLDRLERSFRQSIRFAADASHELRTPLAVMRTHLEHAIADHPRGEQTAVLIQLLEENHHLSSIAEKLLLLAKADAGGLLPGRLPVEFSTLVKDVADDYGVMAGDRSVKVTGEVTERIQVSGDAGLLRQLVLNLFDNALKYNFPGGWIRYRLDVASFGVQLSIANSGPMIPESARSRLFDRFFRIDESRDRDFGGAGLGLSLCREIAHAHGGQLALANTALEGNEFLLGLPCGEEFKVKEMQGSSPKAFFHAAE